MIPLWRLLRWGSPLPIPNREVKPTSADGTWSKARESMSMPILKSESLSENWGFLRLYTFVKYVSRDFAALRSGLDSSKQIASSIALATTKSNLRCQL